MILGSARAGVRFLTGAHRTGQYLNYCVGGVISSSRNKVAWELTAALVNEFTEIVLCLILCFNHPSEHQISVTLGRHDSHCYQIGWRSCLLLRNKRQARCFVYSVRSRPRKKGDRVAPSRPALTTLAGCSAKRTYGVWMRSTSQRDSVLYCNPTSSSFWLACVSLVDILAPNQSLLRLQAVFAHKYFTISSPYRIFPFVVVSIAAIFFYFLWHYSQLMPNNFSILSSTPIHFAVKLLLRRPSTPENRINWTKSTVFC